MRLVRAEILRGRVPGPRARDTALIVLRDDLGNEGVGEASPIAGWSPGETFDDVVIALSEPAERLVQLGDCPSAPADVLVAHKPFWELSDKLARCPTAQFALESALLDVMGQRTGRSVASIVKEALWGSLTESNTISNVAQDGARPQAEIQTSALLFGAAEGAAFIERAERLIQAGFRALKVKLRAEDDAALALEIEGIAKLPNNLDLRLDPNGLWTIAGARRRLGMLAVLHPTFVEQPVPAESLLDLGVCAVPWAADEALAVPGLAEQLSREGGCAAFVIKPAALGIRRAVHLATLARERGLTVTVTHFLDGPIGLAAASETALALSGAIPLAACGLDPHEGLAPAPRALLPHHDRATRVSCARGPGLGLPRGETLRAALSLFLSARLVLCKNAER